MTFFSDGYRRWSAHDVELALWSFHFAKKLQPELLDNESDSSSCGEPMEQRGKKRVHNDKEDDNSSDSDSEGGQGSSSQVTKKRKQ